MSLNHSIFNIPLNKEFYVFGSDIQIEEGTSPSLLSCVYKSRLC